MSSQYCIFPNTASPKSSGIRAVTCNSTWAIGAASWPRLSLNCELSLRFSDPPSQGDPFATDVYKGKGHNKARDIDNASTSSVDVIGEK